jgi:hypothetical protein
VLEPAFGGPPHTEGGEGNPPSVTWDISPNFPPTEGDTAGDTLRWVAFYTDVVHRVEPVTSGIRAVLQFDIIIKKEVGDCANDDNEDEDDNDDYEDENYNHKMGVFKARFDMTVNDPVLLNAREEKEGSGPNVPVIKKLIAALQNEVTASKKIALPMFHLYRAKSVLPEYLKGIDHQLYQYLIQHFDVQLLPVIVTG